MKVEVRVFATLRRYFPDLSVGEPQVVELPDGATIADLLAALGIPQEEVKIAMRNSRQVDWDEKLQDGDRVAFIPAVGGG